MRIIDWSSDVCSSDLQGHVDPEEMMGSWAGAMGQVQFMPSSFVRFAVDENGDGRKDIWYTPADIFASAANYLARSGWRAEQPWGQRVTLPESLNARLDDLKEKEKAVSEWQALGIRRSDGRSEERRGGKAWVSTGKFRWSPEH